MSLNDLTRDELLQRVEDLQTTLTHIQRTYGIPVSEKDEHADNAHPDPELLPTAEYLSALLDALPVRIYAKDEQSRFTYANRATVDALDANHLSEITGKTDEDFYDPKDAARWAFDEQEILSGTRPGITTEEEEKPRGDKAAWVQTTKVPIETKGNTIGVAGLTWNVDLERMQRLELEQYKRAVDGAQEGLWHRTIQPEETVWFSPRWKALIGFDDATFPNSYLAWRGQIHEDDVKLVDEAFSRHVYDPNPDRAPYTCEYRMKHKAGHYVWIRARGQMVIDSEDNSYFAGSHTDITKDKEAQEHAQNAREHQSLYEKILDLVPTLVWIKEVDKDKYGDELPHFFYANKALANAFGKEPSHILGMTDYDLSPEDTADRYIQDDMAVLNSGRPADIGVEPLVNPRTRRELTLATNKEPISGQLATSSALILGVATDISELEQEREKREFERTLLHNLMDNIPDAIYFKDADGRFLRVNARFAHLAGLKSPEQAIGMTHHDLCNFSLQEDHVALVIADEKKILTTHKAIIGETRKVHSQGKDRWGLTDKVPIIGLTEDGTPEVTQIVSISRDITTLVEAESKLKRETSILQTIIDALPQSVFVKGHDYRITHCNRSFALRHPGYTKEQLIGRTDYDLWDDEWAAKYRKDDRQALRGVERIGFQEEQLVGDTIKKLETSKIPLRDPDNPEHILGLVGIYIDITDRIERELLDFHEKVVRTLSHSIRNKLSLVDAIVTEMKNAVADDRDEIINRLEGVVYILQRTATTATRLSASDRERSRTKIPISDLVRYFAEVGFDPRVNVRSACPNACIHGVLDDIENMFLEIYRNACDFAPQVEHGGQISIWTLFRDPHVEIHVADNGDGVPDRLRNGKLFELFASSDPSRTGMGLAYVRKVAEAHGGHAAEIGDNNGAHFVVQIPGKGERS